jgi:hypothetical protein
MRHKLIEDMPSNKLDLLPCLDIVGEARILAKQPDSSNNVESAREVQRPQDASMIGDAGAGPPDADHLALIDFLSSC